VKIKINLYTLYSLCLLLILTGSTSVLAENTWVASPWRLLDGFKSPACVTIDTTDGSVYISNVYTEKPDYWDDDGLGFISKIDKQGQLILRWAEPTPTCALNAPKGLCILNGFLYINDNRRLLRCPLSHPALLAEVKLSVQPARLNSLATDGESLWLTDSKTNDIIRLLPDGRTQLISGAFSPLALSALAFTSDKMYGVSWKAHELYELHPQAKHANTGAALAFNLEKHFINLISVTLLDARTLLVADFWGNKISLIERTEKTIVTTLFALETPAGLAFDNAAGLLYVTQLFRNRVMIFKLVQTGK
jgi:hypothetical protein